MSGINAEETSSDLNKEQRLFKIKDPISFGFSLVAVILTLVNIYLANFRIVNDLNVRTVKYELKEDSTGKTDVYITFAFINSGNREAIVSDGRYYLGEKKDFQKPKFDGNFDNDRELPFTLAAHEAKLITLLISHDSIDEYRKKIGLKREGSKQEINYCAYRFSGIDADGKEHQRSTENDLVFTWENGRDLQVDLLDKEVPLAKVYQIFWN